MTTQTICMLNVLKLEDCIIFKVLIPSLRPQSDDDIHILAPHTPKMPHTKFDEWSYTYWEEVESDYVPM